MKRFAKPTRLGVAISTPFLLASLGLSLWLAERSVLHCERPSGVVVCTLESARVLSKTTQTLAPNSLLGAELEESTTYDPQDHTPTTQYRITLRTTTGMRPMNRSSSGGGSRRATQDEVERINAFVHSPQQPSLTVGQDNRGLIFAGSLLLGVIGLWVMFTAGY
jgi:hypothetical protein